MKTNNRWVLNALLFIAMGVSSMAHAALVGRLAATAGGTDYQAYYDTSANLTWLADMNYAKTTGYDADGRMIWSDANAWVTSLNVAGVTGWRLPDTPGADATCSVQGYYGYNCTGSEMGHLFYNVLGESAHNSITATHNGSYALFSNVQADFYWSARHYGSSRWFFDTITGNQSTYPQNNTSYALAVHSGDVKSLVPTPPVSAVPVPAAIWLFGSGLMGFIGLAKRRTLTLAA